MTLIYISILSEVWRKTYIFRVTDTLNINRKYRGGLPPQSLTGWAFTLILWALPTRDWNGVFYEANFSLIISYFISQFVLEKYQIIIWQIKQPKNTKENCKSLKKCDLLIWFSKKNCCNQWSKGIIEFLLIIFFISS